MSADMDNKTESVFNLEDLILFRYTNAEVIVISILLYALFVAGTTANAILIVNVIRNSAFHTVGYMYMAHLAFGEIVESVTIVLLGQTLSLYWFSYGDLGYVKRWHLELLGCLLIFGYDMSVCLMLVLSINRLCSVVFYAQYKFIFTMKRFYLILFACYAFSLTYTVCLMPTYGVASYPYLPKLWGFTNDMAYPMTLEFFLLNQILATVIVLSMIVMYALIFKKLQELKKNRANATGGESTGHKPKREDILLTVQFFVVTMIFVTLWITLAIYENAIPVIDDPEARKWLATLKNFMTAINCNCNPLIYMAINKRIRVMILGTVTCGKYTGESNAEAKKGKVTSKTSPTDTKTTAVAPAGT